MLIILSVITSQIRSDIELEFKDEIVFPSQPWTRVKFAMYVIAGALFVASIFHANGSELPITFLLLYN